MINRTLGAIRPLLILLFCSALAFAAKSVRFALVAQDNNEEVQVFENILKKEIHDLLTGEFDAEFPEELRVDGDTSVDVLVQKITDLENNSSVDMIIAIGNLPLQAVIQKESLKKPVVAPLVTDFHLNEKNHVKKKNMSYTSVFPKFHNSIQAFKALTGKSQFIVLIDESFKDLDLPQTVDSVSLNYVIVEQGADLATIALPDSVSPVFITPLFDKTQKMRNAFFKNMNDLKIPTYSIGGISDLRGGALLTLTDSADVQRIARTNAINIQSILLGDKPEELSTAFQVRERITINMETAIKCGIDIPWILLSDAEFINRNYTTAERQLTLTSAVEEAISSNLTYLSKMKEVEAGNQDLKSAWSNYLPSLNLGGGLRMIDENSSTMSFPAPIGTRVVEPEKKFYGEVGFQQLIFSDKVITNIGAQRRLADGREAQLDQVKKDIALTAAAAYIRLLETQTYLEINESEYQTLKGNLEIARNGQVVGTTNPADVYRLESEVARQKQRVFESRSAVRRSQLDMNRILHRPLEEEFIAADNVLIEKPREMAKQWGVTIRTQSMLDTFRLYLTETALSDAPELKQIDMLIEAKEKEKREYLRRFIVPEVVAAGGVNKPFATSEDSDAYEERKWNVGVYANWDILSGGSKLIDRKKANYEIDRLSTDRDRIIEELKNRVQNSLLDMVDMISKVSLYTTSAEAAQKNYDIIYESYTRGATDIEGLLGAQNAKFQAHSQQLGAMYQFRNSELGLERSINRLEEFYNKEFVEILKEFSKWLEEKRAANAEQASKTTETAAVN